MVGNVFELVWMKTHEGNELAKSICNRDSVLQKKWALMDEGVLGMVWSCFRLVREYEVCSQSLLLLVLAVMCDMLQNASFLLI